VLVSSDNKHSKASALIVVITVVLFVGGLALTNLFVPKPEVITSERRLPATLVPINLNNILSGKLMSSFENYAADGFVLRETFRSVKAVTVLDIMRLADKDGLYIESGFAGSAKQAKISDVQLTAKKIANVATSLSIENPKQSIYYCIIPDKSNYSSRAAAGFNLNQAQALFDTVLSDYSSIDIRNNLRLEDFYHTDLHWSQPALTRQDGVVEAICAAMGVNQYLSAPTGETLEAGTFAGVYPGQLALPMPDDMMLYVTNDVIRNLRVSYLDANSGEFITAELYDQQAFAGRDPYDFFLRGTQPLVVIENPSFVTNKPADQNNVDNNELVIFRDSFGSSLAPLLAQYYKKVTLIDLRYIDFRALDQYLDISANSDILFLYSSQIIANPTVLLAPG
jgi:hypothetical protein